VEVSYTDEERRAHELLDRYGRARRQETSEDRRAGDLMTLLLKKRFFSSPAAFAATLQRRGAAMPSEGQVPDWARDYAMADEVFADDESAEEAELELFAAEGAQPTDTQQDLLEKLEAWADRYGQRADSKAKAFLALLRGLCCPDGQVERTTGHRFH
jgi:hypothetical protein